MNFILTNDYSQKSKEMMEGMGYIPGLGLGKNLQGATEEPLPIP
ncbi:hypothetical protein T12_1845 [Trichinella patagoniensis]|uniref:G-patch domain-containing protein n=1 Tax=Trichinella patagoniensis TaxID=990121 RepID=A0A0V0XNR8_9BILA|nr:hypothetical protein T12_1845 [Trichinella patagoniensis]